MTDPSVPRGRAAAHPLAAESYVSLTTFRRSGQPVSSPVWIAPAVPDDGDLVVITVDDTGKVKRLRHTPDLELRPCDRRGRVADDAPVFRGTGRIVRDPAEVLAVKRAIGAKYGLGYRVFTAAEAAWIRLRPRRHPRAGVLITPAPAAGE